MKIKLISILILFICCHKTIEEPTDCNGVAHGTAVVDDCGVCSGGNTDHVYNSDMDDCGVCSANGVLQACGCGYPAEYGISAGACDCDGNVLDDCGECDGNGPAENYDCDGDCIAEMIDECGVCAGNGAPCVYFFIESAESTLEMGDTLNINARVENADTLYALSFKLEYESEKFVPINESTYEGTITAGNLFIEQLLLLNSAFIQDGEINVAIKEELDPVLPMASGIACIIKLIAIGPGQSLIEIKDLQMIEPDGTSIDGMSTISVAPLPVIVDQ